jgi:putative ABC transport system permease protein
MNLLSALGAIEIGLIFGLVSLGIFLSFRVLNFPDLTPDGSFPLGGAVVAALITKGVNPFLATAVAIAAGAAAGWTTAYLNVRLRVMQLLAGILVMIALYSVNLRVMGQPNVALIDAPTVFKALSVQGVPLYWTQPLVLLVLVIAIIFILDFYLASEDGLAMRATGVNPRMSRAQGVSTDRQTLVGMALSNGMVALAGALFAQSQGGADISMGVGTIVAGLAAVIIGETLLPSRYVFLLTAACVFGAVLYRFIVVLALNADFLGLQAQDLNFVTSLLVALALILPTIRKQLAIGTRRRNILKGAAS